MPECDALCRDVERDRDRLETAAEDALVALRRVPAHYRVTEVIYAEQVLRRALGFDGPGGADDE